MHRISPLRLHPRTLVLPATTTVVARPRGLHSTAPRAGEDRPLAVDDKLGEIDARGRTGGGKRLEKDTHPPPQPKISNLSVPGYDAKGSLTKEQQEEVDRHNTEFEKKHDRAASAAGDKVDKQFWTGGGGGVQ